MRFTPKTFVALLLGILILPTGVLAPAQAATPTRMTAFTMTPAVSSPTGFGSTRVTVSTHLVDPDGIAPSTAVFDGITLAECPCVQVSLITRTRIPQRMFYHVPLRLTSGTTTDGTWTGQFSLGAGQTGHWRAEIIAGDFGVPLILDPGGQPPLFEHSAFEALPSPFTNVGVDIRGTNHPVIGLLSVVKQANGRYLVKGKAYRFTTRTPIINTRLVITGDCNAIIETHPIIAVRTNNIGVYAVSLTKAQINAGDPAADVCAYQVAYPGAWLLTRSVFRPVPLR